MTKRSFSLLAGLCLIISGCTAPAPKPEDIRRANFGPRPSTELMLNSVKEYMGKRLIDPDSARYQCSTPRKSWITANGSEDDNTVFNRTYYGYYSVCHINAKNRLGGYTGNQEYYFMIYQSPIGPALAHFDGFSAGAPVE